MQNTTLGRLIDASNRALWEGRGEEALAGFATALRIQPYNLTARLRVADALLALGHPQSAALVYTTLARHAAHSGHPLYSLVSIKVLTTLDPTLSKLVNALGDLYARGAERLGPGVRPSPGDPEAALEPPLPEVAQLRGEQLVARASELGGDLSEVGTGYPEKLPPIPLFSELPASDFAAVLDTVRLVRRRPGQTILKEGDEGRLFYVLARGEVEVSRMTEGQPVTLATLSDGAVFGEMALISSSPRSATVAASRDCDLLEFDVDVLMRVSQSVTQLAQGLGRFTRQRLVNNLMNTSPLFRPLEPEQRVDLVRRFAAMEVAPGTDLIREGEAGNGLFVLLHGSVDVWKRDGDEKVLLATLGPGEVFGEISLLNDVPALATVTTAARSAVLFLKREYFDRLLAAVPTLRVYLEELGDMREMDTRLWVDVGSDGLAIHEVQEIDVEIDWS